MAWERKLTSRRKKSTRNHSIITQLRKKGKSTEEFEVMLNKLTLEEIIGLKLELANRAAGGYLYGMPVWHAIPDLVRDAVLKFAATAAKTKGEAARFLGISQQEMEKFNRRYKINYFFNKDERLL
tara:strand:- start:51 stop:425 length:375 start_codon:yes stop_codon:yes gene_type:complete